MWFFGMVMGMLVGGAMLGGLGFFWGGVFGCVGGMIVASRRKVESAAPADVNQTAVRAATEDDRFARLQRTVNELQARIERMERQIGLDAKAPTAPAVAPVSSAAVTTSSVVVPAVTPTEVATAVPDSPMPAAPVAATPAMAADAAPFATLNAPPPTPAATMVQTDRVPSATVAPPAAIPPLLPVAAPESPAAAAIANAVNAQGDVKVVEAAAPVAASTPTVPAVEAAKPPTPPLSPPAVSMPKQSTPASTAPRPAAEPPSSVAPPPRPVSPSPRAPRPSPAAQPAKPRVAEGPGLMDRLLAGNIVAKIGVVILFFGVGFALKLAYENGLFPPELRLLGVAVAAGVLFWLGRRLLVGRRLYAIILMGGGMGFLYLDVFFALKTFQLIGPAAGFALFALLGIATIGLAVRLDARAFAALGLLGGFMAPVLASSGGGHHVLLFSYYLLLNAVIFSASWFKSWRELNLIGFLFTFAIAFLWGNTHYQPAHFNTVEPFLIAFFALYLAIPILFAHRQPPELKGLVDGTLVFGTPMSAAMMQAALTRGMGDHVLAWSAIGVSLVYALLARSLWKRDNMRLLAEAHLALAVVFGTTAPYFAFHGYPTFAFWTLEAAAIYWIGCRQQGVLARAFALCLQLGAAGYFLSVTAQSALTPPWWNDRVVGSFLIALGALVTAWLAHRFRESISAFERALEGWLVGWACLWIVIGGGTAIAIRWPGAVDQLAAALIGAAIVLTLMEFGGRWLHWSALRLAARGHVPLLGVIGLLWAARAAHPLQGAGMLAWPLSFALGFWVLHRQARASIETTPGPRYAAAWGLMLVLATWEAVWRAGQAQYDWVWAIGLIGLLAAGLRFHLRQRATDASAQSGLLAQLPLLWAVFWWFVGLHGLIDQYVAAPDKASAHLAGVAASILLFELAGRAVAWAALRRVQLWLTLILPLAVFVLSFDATSRHLSPLGEWRLPVWVGAFAIALWVLKAQEAAGIALWALLQRLVLLLSLGVLLTLEQLWRYEHELFVSVWAIAAGALAVAAWWFVRRDAPRVDAGADGDDATHAGVVKLSSVVGAWALLWWFAGLHGIIDQTVVVTYKTAAHLAAVALSVLLFELAGRGLAWTALRRVQLLLTLLMPLAVFAVTAEATSQQLSPLGGWQLAAWVGAFAIAVFVLRAQEAAGIALWARLQRLAVLLSFAALLTLEQIWRYDHGQFVAVWAIAAAALALAAWRYVRDEAGAAATDHSTAATRPLALSSVAGAWALLWWFAGLHGLIDTYAAPGDSWAWHLIAVSGSVLLFELLGRAIGWTALRLTQSLQTPAMLLAFLGLLQSGHPLMGAYALAWPLSLALAYFVLYRQEGDEIAIWPGVQQLALFVLAVVLPAWELVWRAERAGLSWSWQYAAAGLPVAAALALTSAGIARAWWPFGAHAGVFKDFVLSGSLLAALLWSVLANAVCDGTAAPLPYLPLLNPFDLVQLALFAAAIPALRRLSEDPAVRQTLHLLFAVTAFYWVNAVLMRSVHQWTGVPFELHALLASVVAQSALSLLWTTTALVLMLAAGRRTSRLLWMVGAALLAVVVAKLFLNDLGNRGTVARIVSFIGVGVLLLVIGYVAPVPPSARRATEPAASGGEEP